jgi:hypothetical protein
MAPVATPVKPRVAIASKLLAGASALIGAVVAAFVLLGSTNSQVTDPVAQAATLSSSTPGFRLNLHMTMTSPALPAPVDVLGNAVVDVRDHAASMTFAIKGPQLSSQLGSNGIVMKMILEGGVMYMKFPAVFTSQLPSLGGKQWLKFDLGKLKGLPGMSSLTSDPTMSDPSQMLQYLRGASSGVSNLGHERVDGVETLHYRATVSLDRLLSADLSASQRSMIQRLEQSTGLNGFPMDVWIGPHHLVRRIAMSIPLRVNGTLLQEDATADITDYGPQRLPTPPSADQVADLSSLIHISN